MLSCALGSILLAVMTGYLTANISSTFSMKIRKKYLIKLKTYL